MIRTILSFFGYVKVPKEAVLLSIEVEDFIKGIAESYDNKTIGQDVKESLWFMHRMANTLTHYLRSGRLISYKKGE